MTTDEIIRLVEILAWPGVILFGLWIFRKSLSAAISRVKKVSPTGGVEIDPGPGQQEIAKPPETVPSVKVDLPPPSEPVTRVMRRLETQLDSLSEKTPRGREGILIRSLAETQVTLHLAQAYNAIFGSQIALLRHLHNYGPTSAANAKKFYDRAAEAFKDAYNDFAFEIWLDYLKNNEFVAVENDIVKPTPLVKEFFLYLTSRHLVEAKWG